MTINNVMDVTCCIHGYFISLTIGTPVLYWTGFDCFIRYCTFPNCDKRLIMLYKVSSYFRRVEDTLLEQERFCCFLNVTQVFLKPNHPPTKNTKTKFCVVIWIWMPSLNPLMHNVSKWSDTLYNLAAFAARFLKRV